MPLPSSGRISLKEICEEWGDTAPHYLSEMYGIASGVPASGNKITFQHFRGKSAAAQVQLTVYGAAGGTQSNPGGQGGTVVWNGLMPSGTVLTLYVASAGANSGSTRIGGGGGGASAVLVGGTLLAVGGGGGGAGAKGGSGAPYGGAGGADTGETGGSSDHAGAASGGAGGSQTGPGASGTGSRGSGSAGSGPNGGSFGSFGVAGGWGYGSGGHGESDGGDGGVGGGGGGYYGGGTGGQNASGAGGGGGSNYRRTSDIGNVQYTSSTTTRGGKTGNGQIIITVDGTSTTYNYSSNAATTVTI